MGAEKRNGTSGDHGRQPVLQLQSLPFDVQQTKINERALPDFHLATVERHHIQKMLHYTKGNKAEAARLMNIGLATLYRKIEEYGLK